MASIEAIYFDGKTARKQPVVLRLQGGEVHVLGAGVNFIEPFVPSKLSEKLGRAPRTLYFANGGHCLIQDHAGLQAALNVSGYRTQSLVSGLESRWHYAIFALLFTLGVIVAAYIWGLPFAAKEIAARIPPDITRKMDEHTMAILSRYALEPTKLTTLQQQKIAQRLQAMQPPAGELKPAYHLIFRNSEAIGPNAFALPGGTILVTDQLVTLAEKAPADVDQVIGVLTHELGHVAHYHALRQFVQGSIVAVVMTWYLGDISSLLATVPTALLQTRYSRALESEADDYAVAMLNRNGLSANLLADMLEKLESFYQVKAKEIKVSGDHGKLDKDKADKGKLKDKAEEGSVVEGYLSSHPLTKDRIKKLRSANKSVVLNANT